MQTIIVFLIVLLACFFIGRRAFRFFFHADASCDSACAGCSGEKCLESQDTKTNPSP